MTAFIGPFRFCAPRPRPEMGPGPMVMATPTSPLALHNKARDVHPGAKPVCLVAFQGKSQVLSTSHVIQPLQTAGRTVETAPEE